jgi:hypothetical protein
LGIFQALKRGAFLHSNQKLGVKVEGCPEAACPLPLAQRVEMTPPKVQWVGAPLYIGELSSLLEPKWLEKTEDLFPLSLFLFYITICSFSIIQIDGSLFWEPRIA